MTGPTQSPSPTGDSRPDPAAIDLEPLKKRYLAPLYHGKLDSHQTAFADLFAAVEALRERVAEVENRYKLYKHIAKGVRGALDGEHTQRDILREFDIILVRAEAAEARAVELADALGFYADFNTWWAVVLMGDPPCGEIIQDLFVHPDDPNETKRPGRKAYTALASTPAKALERAQQSTALVTASDTVIDSGRRLRSDPGSHELALAKLCAVMKQIAMLDVLDQEDGT